ncbi:hypothetical protein V2J09_005949 [Rumex salicifolius]
MASSTSILFLCFYLLLSSASATDADSLLSLKSTADPRNSSLLHWPGDATDFCRWQGVRECLDGRVSKLVLEHLNLTGRLDGKSLNGLDQLRVLSFKDNRLSGEIPDFSGLLNLKSLYLNGNELTGRFPASLAGLHRLKTVVLSDNRLSGEIPLEITTLPRLYTLYLDGNDFSGPVPPLNQPSLQFLNLSGNRFSGRIPGTKALNRFNSSSFSRNPALCGDAILTPCPTLPASNVTVTSAGKHRRKKKTIIIAAASAGAAVALVILLVVAATQRRRKKVTERGREDKKVEEIGASPAVGTTGGGVTERGEGSGYGGGNLKGGFSWESEGLGKLVFVGPEMAPEEVRYSLEELLKASAETLGRGAVGSTYKAVMESGYIVTVKRLKDARFPSLEEFRRQMEVIGKMRHPNLVAIRAYFQAKEERLLVYDYFPNGSLFSLIHGSRPSGGGKPLHWTSCLKIAEDLATGLLYIHQNFDTAHGNLKSSNVLLGSDFESCLTDYCLQSFKNPETADQEPSAASLFYKAPECRTDPARRPMPIFATQSSDVYSFGVVLLELLTGKTPFQDLVQEHGSDIPKWVRSVREEETESGDEPSSGNETSEEKLGALLNIAMACVAMEPESRPQMRDVLRMVREARSEAHMSSNSSDHSPGRWSDTVQSLPREEHQSI